ncbi:TPA: hypothetical protein KUM96_004368 [Serratia marcescens]|nr:hypothetical protein [Serratia marcescens]
MQRSIFQRAGLWLALVSTLVVSSCSYQESKNSQQVSGSDKCQTCTQFRVSVWHVRTPNDDLRKMLNIRPNTSPESLNTADSTIVTSSGADALEQRFMKDIRDEFIGSITGTTAAGDPFPVTLSNAYGTLNGTITAGPETQRLASRVIKFSLEAKLPFTDSDVPEAKIWQSGRVMLRDGEAVVSVSSVRDGWLVWLIGARLSG